jgi:phosphomannomutase/phosphoglucomutase
MRLDCPDDEAKFKLAEAAVKYFSANFNCLDVDGVRIRFDDGWGLVRASNTQPVIVVRFEAKTQERMEEIKGTVLSKLQELGEFTMPEDD